MTPETLSKDLLGSFVDVHVGEIYSLSDFWIQRNEKYQQLQELEVEMT